MIDKEKSADMNDARQLQAWTIARTRKLSVTHLPSGRWRAYTATGTALGTGDYPDPVEALEAAEAQLSAGEARTRETQARRLLDALGEGRYVPWPETGKDGILEWLVLRTNDRMQVGEAHGGLLAALMEIARLNEQER